MSGHVQRITQLRGEALLGEGAVAELRSFVVGNHADNGAELRDHTRSLCLGER